MVLTWYFHALCHKTTSHYIKLADIVKPHNEMQWNMTKKSKQMQFLLRLDHFQQPVYECKQSTDLDTLIRGMSRCITYGDKDVLKRTISWTENLKFINL